jgi:hypothetical protein
MPNFNIFTAMWRKKTNGVSRFYLTFFSPFQMTRLYIQYQNNSPVPLFTQSLPVPQGEEPVVGDLIAGTRRLIVAFFPSADPVTLGQYTLHSVVDGVETSYNSWDQLTILGENGRLGTKPLIIRSRNASAEGIGLCS